ncbi:chemotaxis protein CheV [Helicobacter cetorum]|uniref:Putative chemotaxis protein n=1 Tax=Helicobacter cetorum (strain ATCC BAA-540 / CCUG 52418 / MIT 99-5656) TaxID=1163745 RepID=I0ERI7_HELCM|nr:chemotaxis protein CheV [Helicobacter cetorum]AFI05556.1 putative chemotaxis protein [Helicobacter cetorum MIT 99-5656]
MADKTANALRLSEIELVDFRIYGVQNGVPYEGIYGINVAKVQEIIPMPTIFEYPTNLDYIIGVFDLRSTIIPLIDLSKWIGVIPDRNKENEKIVIITEFNNIKMGFLVHSARRIRRISWKDVEPATFSASNNISKENITGTTRIENDQTLLILDLESILDDLGLNNDSKNAKDFTPKQRFEGDVLFLDDSKTARKTLKTHLNKLGFNITEAVDGEDGLDKLEKLSKQYGNELRKHLKFIISDVEMPKMDGYHFLFKLQEDPRFANIPVIFNSSICDSYSAEKAKEMGAAAYLVKFDVEKFTEEISRILNQNA